MARDKLITIRIEGEKREAFNNLAKSQNTDTASLLYDFISGCLDGRIDISLVTGKGNRLDKLDNRIDSERIDKLETDTQRIDERVGQISKKLNDWVEAFDDRLTDCDRELSDKITSLEHRLNALAIQLDSQEIDRIDTDSQQIDDMKPLLKREKECSIATSPLPTGEPSPLPPSPHGEPDQPAIETVTPEVSPSPPSPLGTDAIASIDGTLESVYTVEAADTVEPDSINELDKGAIEGSEKKIPLPDILIGSQIETVESVCEDKPDAIGTVPGDSDSIGEPCKGMNAAEAFRYVTEKGVEVSEKTLSNWISKIKHIPMTDKGDKVSEYLILRDGRYFPNPD